MRATTRHGWVLAAATVLMALVAGSLPAGAAARTPEALLPIVFVHGSSGSAQQFATQAMRFTSNGYPQDLLFAYEYDTGQSLDDNGPEVDADLDAFIDAVLAGTGAPQVHTVGHSRGTSVLVAYLDDVYGTGTDRAAKVATYVNIDGRSPETLPGGVPTLGIWGEWSSGGEYCRPGPPPCPVRRIGPDGTPNVYFPDKGHTEVATSAEAFAAMYELFTGEAPATTAVIPEPPAEVTVAGRVTLFPQNEGYEGVTLEVWEVDPATGRRVAEAPLVSGVIDGSGDFGPFAVVGGRSYEFAVVRPGGPTHHFYQEPFTRSDHFVRLQTSRPGEGIALLLPESDASASFVILRQREWWGDQPGRSDALRIDGLDLMTPQLSPRADVNLAVFAQDDGGDLVTDLERGVVPPFDAISFLTAADVHVPADADGTGTVRVEMTVRDSGRTVTVATPNWPSSDHRITIGFRDDVEVIPSWALYVVALLAEAFA